MNYRLVEEDGATGAEFKAKPKSWGPNLLQFGISLDDDLEGTALAWAGEIDEALSLLRRAVVVGGRRSLVVGESWWPLLDALREHQGFDRVWHGVRGGADEGVAAWARDRGSRTAPTMRQ